MPVEGGGEGKNRDHLGQDPGFQPHRGFMLFSSLKGGWSKRIERAQMGKGPERKVC